MKKKEIKSIEKRKEEIEKMKTKLKELGIPDDNEGMSEFNKALIDFEKGFGSSGNYKLNGLKRRIEYILTCNPKIESSLVLRYDPNV